MSHLPAENSPMAARSMNGYYPAFPFPLPLCLDGGAALRWQGGEMSVRKGESIFIPAGFGKFSVSDGAELIMSTR